MGGAWHGVVGSGGHFTDFSVIAITDYFQKKVIDY